MPPALATAAANATGEALAIGPMMIGKFKPNLPQNASDLPVGVISKSQTWFTWRMIAWPHSTPLYQMKG
jgi:hypothetical protein